MEENEPGDVKWRTLSWKGPAFTPAYKKLPENVKFYYEGKPMKLSKAAEEVAGLYGQMLDHEYTSNEIFNSNFFKDWREVMTLEEKGIIIDLRKCNFNDFNVYYKQKSKERKKSEEEKAMIKNEQQEYGFCIIDGHKEKIGNFKIKPPSLFRGRGENPKMGMLKRRVQPEDITINIGMEAQVPEPPRGHQWREVRHDQTVTWLATWEDKVTGIKIYIRLHPSSKLMQKAEFKKFETARQLKCVEIHKVYTRDLKISTKLMKSEEDMLVLQRTVSIYLLDKMALRAGTKKDMDTVGLCSIRVEHIKLEKNGKNFEVKFDFLGKGSIRYENTVVVEKTVYKCLKLFMDNKQPGDQLFDLLNTKILNKYLDDLMKGLTAKVFRTYNACKLMEEKLDELTKVEMSEQEKILAYNKSNIAVAILCNHRRDVPKNFSKSMENLKKKIDTKQNQINEFKKVLKIAQEAAKESEPKEKLAYNKKKKVLAELEEQLEKLKIQAIFKEDTKTIYAISSKNDYLDPRITVAWCKKWNVPIEKIYTPMQIKKFQWAIDMDEADYQF